MGGGGSGGPRPSPWIRHWTVTHRAPKVWTEHNFAGTQVLVLRHQVWAAPKRHVLSRIPLPPPLLSPSLSLSHCKPCVTGFGDILTFSLPYIWSYENFGAKKLLMKSKITVVYRWNLGIGSSCLVSLCFLFDKRVSWFCGCFYCSKT